MSIELATGTVKKLLKQLAGENLPGPKWPPTGSLDWPLSSDDPDQRINCAANRATWAGASPVVVTSMSA